MESFLKEYKNELKKYIEIAHMQIQNMDWDFTFDLLSAHEILTNGYNDYYLSKIYHLHSSEENIDDIWKHKDEEYLPEKLATSVKEYLSKMMATKNSYKLEDLNDYRGPTNSKWISVLQILLVRCNRLLFWRFAFCN